MFSVICFASSIGRVTGRLPKELADDVVGSVLECLRYGSTHLCVERVCACVCAGLNFAVLFFQAFMKPTTPGTEAASPWQSSAAEACCCLPGCPMVRALGFPLQLLSWRTCHDVLLHKSVRLLYVYLCGTIFL